MEDYKKNCPYCNTYETVYHVYQCDEDNQRSHLMGKMERQLQELNTRPNLQSTIMRAFSEGSQNNPKTEDPTPAWYICLGGLLPEEWADMQQDYIEQEKLDVTPKTGAQWMKKFSYWLLQEGYKLWKKRNNKLHRQNNTSEDHQHQIHHQVQQLYQTQSAMNAADRIMFDMPIEQRLQQPLAILKKWVEQTYITAKVCIDEHRQKILHGQKDIRQYFEKKSELSEKEKEDKKKN